MTGAAVRRIELQLALFAIGLAPSSLGCDIFAALTGAQGLPCATDQACPVGSTCVAATCQRGECRGDGDCASGQQCVRGFCRHGSDASIPDHDSLDGYPADTAATDATRRDVAADAAARDHASLDARPDVAAVVDDAREDSAASDTAAMERSPFDRSSSDLALRDVRSGEVGVAESGLADAMSDAASEAGVPDRPSFDLGANDARSGDAGGGDVSSADATTQPTCVQRFGSALDFMLCHENQTECEFSVTLQGSNCRTLCEQFGSTCLTAYDNVMIDPCTPYSMGDDCTTNRTDEICVCTR